VTDAFQQALTAHQHGRLAEAARLYQDILAERPDHADVLHLLGLIALQTGSTEQGVALIRRSIGLNTANPIAHGNLGKGLLDLGRPEDALACYDTAIALHPDYAEAHGNRGAALRELGRAADAIDSYDRAIALKPDFPEAHFNRGNLLLTLNRSEEAVASYDRAIAQRPHYAEAHGNRGQALLNLGRVHDAIASCDAAISARPDLAEAWCVRGNAQVLMKRYEEAVESFDRAIALRPDHAKALSNRAIALTSLNRPAEALASADAAIALRPDYAEAHHNRGTALRYLGRREEALESLDRAIALRPGYAGAFGDRGLALIDLMRLDEAIANLDRSIALDPNEAHVHNNRGIALFLMKRFDEAQAAYDAALAREPGLVGAHWNQSLALLQTGRFAEGWAKYEWRKKLDPPMGVTPDPAPAWTGAEDIAGKTILLYHEQGFGDTIQFFRHAAQVRARGARVIAAVPEPLVRLLSLSEPDITVVDDRARHAPVDYHCAFMSLPLALGITLETVPAAIPYLVADPGERASWSARLKPLTGLKAGLVWAGGHRPGQREMAVINERRSTTLATLAPLADVPGVSFVSLQTGPPGAEAARPPPGMSLFVPPAPRDFASTAAVIEALDLVISVDTAVAHLAGALGKPVWLLSRHDNCWRWLDGRQDSPWYPTMRIFTQPAPLAWAPVVAAVRAALMALSGAPRESPPAPGPAEPPPRG
jgi:tetratricopeptide (TPR) repeat protein